ncbi:MAG: S8 family serine peptidase [Scytonematopsis contorta HA4267-MV1]|jgi:subtilisin family serine protease|nr:S8 family serine peptidase [Scytonematopsis contorta HA4267-MV1]
MNEQSSLSNSPTTGVPESNLGVVLQRGGQEFILEKVPDRFTVRPTGEITPEDLSRDISRNISRNTSLKNIAASWRRSIPQAQLEVFTVTPGEVDGAMSTVRNNKNVAFASHVYRMQDNPGSLVYVGDQITIQFASWVDPARINSITTTFGLVLDKPVKDLPNTFVFLVSQQSTENPVKIANRLQGLSEVLLAEPNIIVRQEPHYKPRDPLYPQQWYLNHNGGNQLAVRSHISVEKAWDITRGVRSVVVAVVDDSFDLDHPDFQGSGKIVAPRDLKDNDFLPLSSNEEKSHGTACAGIAIAEENGTGIAGVAPGCAFMPIRTTGFLDDESIEEIFNWALAKGASIISCSWGASAVNFPLSLRQRAAITRAATKGRNNKGCVILFAAGNANRPINGNVNEQNWPKNIVKGNTKWLSGFAVHPDVLAISASTSLNKKANYSNWGANISVCAPSNNAPGGMWFQETGFLYTQPLVSSSFPGLGMLTIDQLGAAGYDIGDFTSNFGGTSSATPVVAGVAALILSANPDLTCQQVKLILQETADKIVDSDPDPQLGIREGTYDNSGHSEWFGYGKVNAAKAVQMALSLRQVATNPVQEVGGRNDTKQNIPDNDRQGVKSVISILASSQANSQVRSIRVSIDLTHEFLGDLEIYLITPNNQQVLLQSRTLGRRNQLQATYTPATHPILKQLLGVPSKGRWQLWVIDLSPQDVGTFNNWELILGI